MARYAIKVMVEIMLQAFKPMSVKITPSSKRPIGPEEHIEEVQVDIIVHCGHTSGHVKIYLTYNFISDWLKRCTGKFTRESVQFFDRLQKDSRDEIQRRSSKKIETGVE